MLKRVFEPYAVKGMTVRNRLVVAPMVANFCELDGKATERYIAYHEEKAKGGFGLIITEDYAVAPTGKGFTNVAGLWEDEQIPGHTELVNRVHKHGAKIFAQIYHAGRQSNSFVIGQAPLAPSAIPDPTDIEVPQALTVGEIETIIKQFGDTAVRAQKCGFDGVQVHGAHGYLVSEFMSPYANKRIDQYGGNLMNRMRFPLAIVKEIRNRCGDDMIIDFRISSDEMVAGGLTIEDVKTIAMLLEDAGIDMIHISVGVYASQEYFIPPQVVRHGALAQAAAAVKSIVNIPVTTVCRVNEPLVAEQILASGYADLVAMGRQSLCDPATPNKAKEGRLDDIRYCTACNQGCVTNLLQSKSIACALNPTLGLEYQQPDGPAQSKKEVAVIGGGPAGMQAAITAAERGHSVTLYEKGGELGGQFRVAAYPPAKGELTAFIAWQITQMDKLGVTVKMNTEANADVIGKTDAVILATGGTPMCLTLKGCDGPNVVFAEDILSGKLLPPAQLAVVGGGQIGAETADYLSALGRQVTLIEMLYQIAPLEAYGPRVFLLKSLAEKGVQMLTSTKVKEVTDAGVLTECGREIPAEMVVLAIGVEKDNSLEAPLKEAGHNVTTVGDASEVRNVTYAVLEGHEAALKL